MFSKTQNTSKRLRVSFPLFGLFCLGCLVSVIATRSPLDQSQDNIALVVGSNHISSDRLKADLIFISAGMQVPKRQRDRVRDQLLEQCINHYLIMEYGKEHGIKISEKEMQNTLRDIKKGYTDVAFDEALLRGYMDLDQWKNRVREQVLTKKIIEKVSEDVTPPEDRDIKQYFEKNQAAFQSPRMIEFRQIVTRTKEEAETLLKRLHAGGKMDALAKKFSIAPEAENGGKVGWVSDADLDESMGTALFSMSQGQISPVIKTPYGYHIFEVLSIRPAGRRKLSEVVNEIQSRLLLERRKIFLEKWLTGLRNHFKVKINQHLLDKLEFF